MDEQTTETLILRNLEETKPRRNRWEKIWQQYAARIQSGLCTCKRHLLRGVCSAPEGGCGNPPLPLTPKAGRRCWCPPAYHDTLDAVMSPITQFIDAHPTLGQIVIPSMNLKTIAQVRAAPINELPIPVQVFLGQSQKNMHCTMVATGLPGKGKSYSLMRILELIDPTFDLSRVIYTKKDLLYWTYPGRLARRHPGARPKALLVDEGGPLMSSKRSLSLMNQFLSELFQTFRQDCAVVAICVPLERYIELVVRELVQYKVEALGVDYGRRQSLTRITRVSHIRDKMGKDRVLEYPIALGAGKIFGWSKPQRIPLGRPSDDPLSSYEAKKLFARQQNAKDWEVKFAKSEAQSVSWQGDDAA